MKERAVNSSTVLSIGYDARAEVLQITFVSGEKYQYSDVPAIVADEFIHSPVSGSYGKHFNEWIKGVYEFRKV